MYSSKESNLLTEQEVVTVTLHTGTITLSTDKYFDFEHSYRTQSNFLRARDKGWATKK